MKQALQNLKTGATEVAEVPCPRAGRGQLPIRMVLDRMRPDGLMPTLQLDNFRRLAGFGWPGFSKMNLWRQDKGRQACTKAFVDAVRHGGTRPVPLEQLLEVGRISIEIEEALR